MHFFSSANQTIAKLQLIQNTAVRIVTKSNQDLSYYPLSLPHFTGWLCLSELSFKILFFTFKALHRLVPKYILFPKIFLTLLIGLY